MHRRLLLVLALCSIVPMAMADTVIESFENANPAGWRTTSPQPGQDRNIASPRYSPIPQYVTEHVTHGAAAGRFGANWTLPGVDYPANANVYESGGTTLYWALRISTASGAALGNIPTSAELHADIYNRTADPMQFAFVVSDGGLERGPLTTLAPNASTEYVWKLSEGCTGWVTGNGVWNSGTVVMNSMLLYTTTAPTAAQFTFDIDNVRVVTPQTDFTPPAPPVLLSLKQGTNPGDLLVSWVANTEPDLDHYAIYLGTNSNFAGNRMTFPSTPFATAASSATSAVLTGVTPEQAIYIRLTAFDNATPQQNESGKSIFLAARLRADGGSTLDQIVLDLDRYPNTNSYFVDAGYYHMSVYNAQALATNGRNYISCLARAVADGSVVLAPSTNTFVVWSNGMDGDAAGSAPTGGEGLSEANVSKLASYIDAGGRLMISGTGFITDLNAGSSAKQAFLADKLKAILVSDNIASDTINTSGIFTSLSAFRTGTDLWSYAAWAGTHNDQIAARSGAVPAMNYNSAESACVCYGEQVVSFGFEFEMVRPDPCTSFAQGAAARAALMADVIDYLTSPPVDTPTPSTGVREFEVYE